MTGNSEWFFNFEREETRKMEQRERAAELRPASLRRAWPDPTPEMLDDPQFNAIWEVIKTWDINVPGVYIGYCGATGNHARAIFDSLYKEGQP